MEVAPGFGPTSWSWRADVERLAWRFARRYSVAPNTYVDHPPGMHLDTVSIDFWGPGGRGDFINRRTARHIVRRLRNRKKAPHFRWIIFDRVGWYPDGTTFTPPGGDSWNAGHVHVTFW